MSGSMKARRLATAGCLVGALALGVGACGGDDDGGGAAEGGGKNLTIYSSMPLQGASSPQTKAIVNGMELALDQAGNKAGEHTLKFVSLDNSTAQAGTWTPEATTANARKAAQDDSTGVYIGEFNSGAAAVSIPILNEGGVPQISPANTAVGLTTEEPGSTAGEPDKYYPTGQRTYARIAIRDSIQAPALLSVMEEDGCTKVAMTNDKEVYGAGLAEAVEAAAGDYDLEILSNDAIDKNSPNYRSLAQSAASAGADCFIFSGITGNNAVQLYKDFAAALPDAKLYGPDGVCESGFTDPKEGGVPAEVGARFQCTSPSLPPSELPPDGQDFFTDYGEKYGDKTPDPYSIYGYESMRLAIDAIERSGSGEKEDIVKALFDTQDREGVLGTYSIDDNGDTTLTDRSLEKVEDGQLTFVKVVKGAAP
jgi:branched-chain amino acid transport system substrate-binding protein